MIKPNINVSEVLSKYPRIHKAITNLVGNQSDATSALYSWVAMGKQRLPSGYLNSSVIRTAVRVRHFLSNN